MKNMLLVAGIATLSFATLLVWMENAYATQLERYPFNFVEPSIPQPALPADTLDRTTDKPLDLALPEIEKPNCGCSDKTQTCIP
ncbi:MAG: hypothetical protein EP344_02905 [Bacteroidetes bacterium]|nr:MAG: hypothetical protein EP344_02905 [Bacteroidota bacterium]